MASTRLFIADMVVFAVAFAYAWGVWGVARDWRIITFGLCLGVALAVRDELTRRR